MKKMYSTYRCSLCLMCCKRISWLRYWCSISIRLLSWITLCPICSSVWSAGNTSRTSHRRTLSPLNCCWSWGNCSWICVSRCCCSTSLENDKKKYTKNLIINPFKKFYEMISHVHQHKHVKQRDNVQTLTKKTIVQEVCFRFISYAVRYTSYTIITLLKHLLEENLS